MSHFYGMRTTVEDRDLSRAAAERHFMLHAVAERKASSSGSVKGVLLSSNRQRWARRLRFTLRRAA